MKSSRKRCFYQFHYAVEHLVVALEIGVSEFDDDYRGTGFLLQIIQVGRL
jgi:hypothetical protein